MAKRQTTFLLKRSNVPGKIPPISGLTSGELALNTADAILYTSGSTSGTILPIGWDRVARTGDTMTGTLFTPYLSATTVSATTYLNLPIDIRVTGGTYAAGTATFTNNTGGTFTVTGFSTGGGSTFTGGTVTGPTNFTNGLTATTISATTYFNLPTDIRVTGGTYTNGTATFVNNTGGTFTVTGFSTGGTSSTDTFVTGATYSNNTFTYRNNTGGTFNVLFNTMTGLTSTGTISSSILSATTYQNLPTDIRVTGGTFSSGTATFTNNTGGTFTVTGFSTGGGTFTGGTVSGATYFTGGVSATTISATTYLNLPSDIRVTGATYSNNTFNFTNNTGGTFNILFNTVTGLTVNGSVSANNVYVVSATTGTSVSNLGIQSDGKIIKTDGNAIVDNFYYSISNTVDTRPIFEDSNVTFGWDETGNDLEFTMKVAPGGSGDMRSLAYIVGGSTQNTAIVSTGVAYDIYAAGVSAGNRLEVFITAENDVTYPAYHVTVYNTGESFHNTVWIQRITRI